MEFNKIEVLLEKYFEGETNTMEENELKKYFSSSNVALHLEQYKPLFGFFIQAKEIKCVNKISLNPKKKKSIGLSIAASIVVLFGIGTFVYLQGNKVTENKELGSYENPKEALIATQKALAMLSINVNTGIEGVQYIQVYEVTKNKIFVE